MGLGDAREGGREMENAKLGRWVVGLGSVFHFFSLMAGASAVFMVWQSLGSWVRNGQFTNLGLIGYRFGLCAVFLVIGIALASLGRRLGSELDEERSAAGEAERAEVRRMTHEIHAPVSRRRRHDEQSD